jgi:tetratricopeptide (TPR) repeat protein
MKQDEFVSWVTRATLWVEQNVRTVLMSIGALAAVIVVVSAGMVWQRARTERAYEMLAEVQRIGRTALVGEPGAGPEAFTDKRQRAERVVSAADRMLESHSRGPAARWARYVRAEALLELGRLEEASQDAESVAGSAGRGTFLGGLAGILAGRAEEARGNLQRAADLYALVADASGAGFPPEIALLDQARCLSAMGEREQAISAYQKILDVYPDSPVAAKASSKLQDLQGSTDGA